MLTFFILYLFFFVIFWVLPYKCEKLKDDDSDYAYKCYGYPDGDYYKSNTHFSKEGFKEEVKQWKEMHKLVVKVVGLLLGKVVFKHYLVSGHKLRIMNSKLEL